MLAPDFAKSQRVYFSFFELMPDRNSNTNLAYGTLDEAGNAVHDVTVIFRGKPTNCRCKNFSSKQGGRIAFAKDGSLFMTMGDRDGNRKEDYDLALAQKLDNHHGQDHAPDAGRRARARQSVPEQRPARCRKSGPMACAARKAWRSRPTARLWETEHGPRGGDELNLIKQRQELRLADHHPWHRLSRRPDRRRHRRQGRHGAAGLLLGPGDRAVGPGLLSRQAVSAMEGSLFVGALRGMGVYRLELKNSKVVAEEPLLTDLKKRIRDVRVGPDGAVYVLTEQKALLKLTPQ